MSDSAHRLQNTINRQIPIREGLSVLAGPIQDRTVELFAEERLLIGKAIAKRQHEFATVRSLAREAMAELGLPAGPILKGSQREPIWPPDMLGSLTHAEDCAVASVARAGAIRSVGIDLEVAGRVGPELHGKLFTARERAELERQDPALAGLCFSAKEAVYKAVFPLVGRFIGFQEAEVDVDEGRGQVRFRYVGDHEPNRVMERAEGWFLFSGQYVLSLVIIP